MDLLDGLKAFVATAQTGSFTEAADRMGVSNRITSKYVAQLEERIGARLLQRTTRKVGLTPTGQVLLERAPALLEELEELLGSVGEEAKAVSGVLRVAAPVTFGEMRLNGMMSRFLCQYPDISIDLRLNDAHVDLAQEGFDLAFRVGVPDVATLRARKLGYISSVLVASPDYLKTRKLPETPDDLSEHLCIVDTNRRDYQRWKFYKDSEEFTFHTPRHLLVNSARITRDWVVEGRGVALCPYFVVEQDLQQGRVVPLLTDFTTDTRPMCAVYLAGHVTPKKVRALIDFAVADFERYPLQHANN